VFQSPRYEVFLNNLALAEQCGPTFFGTKVFALLS